jgi:hypothetical protein
MSLLNRPVYLIRLTTIIEKFFGLEPADTTFLINTEAPITARKQRKYVSSSDYATLLTSLNYGDRSIVVF